MLGPDRGPNNEGPSFMSMKRKMFFRERGEREEERDRREERGGEKRERRENFKIKPFLILLNNLYPE